MPNCPCANLCGEDEKGNRRCPTLKLIAAIVIIIILLLIIILPLALTLGQDEEAPLSSTNIPFMSSSTGQPPTTDQPSTGIKDPFPTLAKWRPDPPPVANCSNFGFQCLSGERIGTRQRCNGRMDCIDGSDEIDCRECRTSFSCQQDSGDLKCVSADSLCKDGAPLCPRREDTDLYCSGECDLTVNYKCRGHNRCIPTAWMCDGEQHCPEGDDEEGCKKRDCRHGSFWCKGSRRCLPSWFKCDGSRQCADGSDEVGCDCRGCSGKEVVLCADPGGMCLRRAALCDGKKDCPGGQDEINCPGYCEAEAVVDKVLCEDGERVSLRMACSGQRPQCEDRCARCDPELAFTCADGDVPGRRKCIQRFQVCDGRPDCGDASDEKNCGCERDGDWECPPVGKVMFQSAPKCIRASQRCDGYPDCPNGDDEMYCETCQVSVEGAVPVHCKEEKACYPSVARCDGNVNCGDYSDEDHCPCSACKSHDYQTFMCRANQRCLRQDFVCNPSSPFHCPGAMPEDEMYCQPDYDPLRP